jgi:hypothetical protein
LVAELAGAVRAEVAADHAVAKAKARRHNARRRTLAAVAQLRAVGVTLTRAATIVARELGLRPDVGHRRRIAARLRDRLYRQSVAEADANLPSPPVTAAPVSLPSEAAKEAAMNKLIRRVTETFIDIAEDDDSKDAKLGAIADLENDAEDCDEEDDVEPLPSRRSRARRSR